MSERPHQHVDDSAFAEAAFQPSIPRSFAATQLSWITEEEGHTIDEVLATLRRAADARPWWAQALCNRNRRRITGLVYDLRLLRYA
jgi:hypothetical protein